MKKLAGYGTDDHPPTDTDRAPVAWSIVAMDDCDECGDLRVELTLEEVGRPGTGLVGHLAPETARSLRSTIARALREMGEDEGP